VVVRERVTKEIQGVNGAPAPVHGEPAETLTVILLRDEDLSAIAALDSNGAVLEDARVFLVPSNDRRNVELRRAANSTVNDDRPTTREAQGAKFAASSKVELGGPAALWRLHPTLELESWVLRVVLLTIRDEDRFDGKRHTGQQCRMLDLVESARQWWQSHEPQGKQVAAVEGEVEESAEVEQKRVSTRAPKAPPLSKSTKPAPTSA
jgi:hypothetical protein